MIFALTFLLMLFAPGNSWLFFSILIFSYPHIKVTKDIPQKLFLAWMAVAFIACIFSQYKAMAFFGNSLRMEGFLTWLLIARLAWLYWETQENFDFLLIVLIVAIIIFFGWSLLNHKAVLVKMSMAGLAAVAISIMWAWMPSSAILYLPLVIFSDSRAAVIGAIGGITVHTVLKHRKAIVRKWRGIAMISVGVLVLIAISPVGRHFRSFSIDRAGAGARTHWIIESVRGASFIGHGLDTQSNYLTQKKGDEVDRAGGRSVLIIADRAHNIIFDTLLTTGIVGLLVLLLIFGSALGMAINYPSNRNLIAISGISAWAIVGLMNPQGISAHILATVCLIGMTRKSEDE